MSLVDKLGLQVGTGDEEQDVTDALEDKHVAKRLATFIGPPGPLAYYLAQPPLMFPAYSPSTNVSINSTRDTDSSRRYDSRRTSSRRHSRRRKDQPPEITRTLSALRLAMLAYFFTCGGPFGIESTIGAGGAVATFIAFVTVPWVWSVPQALMSAELALMMPYNGGNILWVRRAFGNFLGWVNAYNFIICAVGSLSLYPILFVDYLPGTVGVDMAEWVAILIKLAFVVVCVATNLYGIDFISRLSLLMLVFILSPFVAEFIAGYAYGKTFHWGDLTNYISVSEMNWGVFLSTVLWSYGGYDSVGSVAGEVKGGRPTFIKGIAASLPLAILNYFIPLMLGWVLHPNIADWQSGYFPDIGFKIGSWLGYWLVVAAEVANTGTYMVTLASLARVLWACGVGPLAGRMMPEFVSISVKSKNGTVRPVAAILILGICTFGFSILSYNTVVQVTMSFRIVNLFFEYGALIYMKWSEPNTPRPFAVPGGKIGAILITIPTVILGIVLLYGAGLQIFAVAMAGNLVIIWLYWIRRAILVFCTNESMIEEDDEDEEEEYVEEGEENPHLTPRNSTVNSLRDESDLNMYQS